MGSWFTARGRSNACHLAQGNPMFTLYTSLLMAGLGIVAGAVAWRWNPSGRASLGLVALPLVGLKLAMTFC